jgi:class 3 adenylate cyclase
VIAACIASFALLPVWGQAQDGRGSRNSPPRAEEGLIDLSAWSFADQGRVKLNGTWRFFPDRFLPPAEVPDLEQEPQAGYGLAVPQKWSHSKVPGYAGQWFGHGTYVLNVQFSEDAPEYLGLRVGLIGTSHRLYVDGRLQGRAGEPGSSRNATRPGWKPYIVELQRSGESMQLVLHVANYHDMTGGIHYPISVGTPGQVYETRYSRLLFDLFLFGSLIIMAFYHLGLYIYRRKDRSPLYFAALSFLLALRIIIHEEIFILELWPELSWKLLMAASFLTFSLSAFSFFRFISAVFPDYVPRPARRVVDAGSLLYTGVIIAAPLYIYIRGLMPFQFFTLAVGLFVIYVLLRAAKDRRAGANLFIFGFLIFFLTIIHDIVKTRIVISTMFLVPFGLLIFVFFQSLVMTRKFAAAFASSEQMSEHLMRLNSSMERFVPREFLAFLKKESLTEVELGDHASRRMSVLFIDIRDFTSLSEKMKPEENFRFINSFLSRMGPIVRTYHGFVDKYLGDGIMALFPGKPSDALGAAVEMRRELHRYNHDRAKAGYRAINFGVGIHTGELMLGTVGENQRMDGTVISDAVNLASRIETLTKTYDIGIAVSEETYRESGGEECGYSFRYLGKERVKGKEREVAVFEVTGLHRAELPGNGEEEPVSQQRASRQTSPQQPASPQASSQQPAAREQAPRQTSPRRGE